MQCVIILIKKKQGGDFLSEKLTDTSAVQEQQEQAAPPKKLVAPREIAAYALTSYGINNLNSFIGSTKQYFMMSFLGISGTQYGVLGTASSIWDAMDDPISGVVIDRMRTRWGRLRPFLVFPTPLWALTSILFYVVPGNFSVQQRFWYALISTIIHGIGFSYLNGWELLLYNITPNTDERSRLIATNKFVNLFTYLPSLVPLFVDFIPSITSNNVTQPTVYTSFSVVFVIFAIFCTLFGFFNMRERVSVASKEEMKEKGILKSVVTIFKCRPLFVLLLSNFFASVKGVGGASEDFFWLNCTGRLSNRLLASLFTGIPNYVITPLAPKMVEKLGLRTTAISAGIFSAVAYTALYFIGYSPTESSLVNFIWVTFALTICGLPNHVMSVCDPLLKGDMYDYLEWTSGIRSEGLVNAVSGYVNKLSGSVISLLSGAVFDWIKFKPQKDMFGNIVPHTNPKVLKGIWGIFCLAPAVARYGYALALLLFNVHGKLKNQMLIELDERHAERAESIKAVLDSENAT